MVILHLFDLYAGLAHKNTPLEAGVATTAVTGEHLDAIQRGDDTTLHATGIERFVALECAIDLDQHPLQTF